MGVTTGACPWSARCMQPDPLSAAAAADLALGPFKLTPSLGTIEPGATALVSVTFAAKGRQVFTQVLGVHVENRAFTDHPEGVPFELIGESCIPGIDCQRVEGIFEEHVIKKELDAFNCGNNEYGMRDKVRRPDALTHEQWESQSGTQLHPALVEDHSSGATVQLKQSCSTPCVR